MRNNHGFTAKDVVTGFTGIITGSCSYISGCDQYLLTPQVNEDGAYKDGQWFDTSRVVIDKNIAPVRLDNDKVISSPGSDKSAPKR